MSTKVNYDQILAESGPHPYNDVYIRIPKILANLTAEIMGNRYQYGPTTEPELGEDCKAAADCMSNGVSAHEYVFYSGYYEGHPGISYAGNGTVGIEGQSYPIAALYYLGVGLRDEYIFTEAHAAEVMVKRAFYPAGDAFIILFGRLIHEFGPGAPIIDKKYLVKLPDYEGPVTGYDTISSLNQDQFGRIPVFDPGTFSNTVASTFAGILSLYGPGQAYIDIASSKYFDKYGNEIN